MNQNQQEEISLADAIDSWYKNVYFPLASIISKNKMLRSFPHRTIGDLYVWLVRYWDDLKKKFGDDFSIDEAAKNFTKIYKIPLRRRIMNRIKSIILRRAIEMSTTETLDKETDAEASQSVNRLG